MTASLASRAKRNPALLKKALADPGLRSKLPASMLSVAQRRARATNATQAALGDVTTPLTGKALVDVAKQLIGDQYKPQFGALDTQASETKAQSTQAQAKAHEIYDQLAKYQTSAMAAQQANQGTTATGITNATQAALGQLTLAQKQQQAQAQHDEQVRGAGLDGGAQQALANEASAAQGVVTARGQSAANTGQLDAQAANAVLGGIGASTQQRGAEQQNDISNATSTALKELAGKRTDLTAAQGSALTDAILKLRQSGSDAYLTGQGLNLKTATSINPDTGKPYSVEEKAASAKAASHKWAASEYKYGITNGAWADYGKTAAGRAKRQKIIDKYEKDKTSGSSSGKEKPATPTQQGDAHDAIAGAATIAQSYAKAGVSKDQMLQTLVRGAPADKTKNQPAIKPVKQLFAQAAIELSYPPHKLSKATVDALHARKINIGDLGLNNLIPLTPGLNVALPGVG